MYRPVFIVTHIEPVLDGWFGDKSMGVLRRPSRVDSSKEKKHGGHPIHPLCRCKSKTWRLFRDAGQGSSYLSWRFCQNERWQPLTATLQGLWLAQHPVLAPRPAYEKRRCLSINDLPATPFTLNLTMLIKLQGPWPHHCISPQIFAVH